MWCHFVKCSGNELISIFHNYHNRFIVRHWTWFIWTFASKKFVVFCCCCTSLVIEQMCNMLIVISSSTVTILIIPITMIVIKNGKYSQPYTHRTQCHLQINRNAFSWISIKEMAVKYELFSFSVFYHLWFSPLVWGERGAVFCCCCCCK